MIVVLLGQVKSTEDDVFLLLFVLSASRLFASARLFFVGRGGVDVCPSLTTHNGQTLTREKTKIERPKNTSKRSDRVSRVEI